MEHDETSRNGVGTFAGRTSFLCAICGDRAAAATSSLHP